jgi:hypothetical protein
MSPRAGDKDLKGVEDAVWAPLTLTGLEYVRMSRGELRSLLDAKARNAVDSLLDRAERQWGRRQ